MQVPEHLLYTREHQWVFPGDHGLVAVGVTDFFQRQMEEIIFVERPPEGELIAEGETLFLIESGKTVYEFTSPLSGMLLEANAEVIDRPGIINTDPYGRGWLIRVETTHVPRERLLSPGEYREFSAHFTYPLPPVT
ncbi:MAG: glycine cleavage system protein H [Deltaproteobacteria bacterium]|nr:glycine cleavage system protein H [Deltaproteobacteria bacterium]NIS76187.1 glycine cleavage system protein H [Deltaproteobacteria bacterium]